MAHAIDMPVADPTILKRFYVGVPRHSTYPPTDRFIEAFGPENHSLWLRKRSIGGFSRNLGLYVQIPSRDTVCPICGRTKPLERGGEALRPHLDYLERELRLQSRWLDERAILHLYWGGDTASLLRGGSFSTAVHSVNRYFRKTGDTRHTLEIDPIEVDAAGLADIVGAGVNQLQITVRECASGEHSCADSPQILDATESLVASGREQGIRSVSIGLVFGVPGQTVMSFNRTLKRVLLLLPERLSLMDYTRLCAAPRIQQKTNEADFLAEQTRIQLFGLAVKRLSEAGYHLIGMDHFARADDELAVAQRQGRLHRNLEGYCTHFDCDLLGLGPGAISEMGPTYSQNARSVRDYYDLLDEDVVPISRGIELTTDDLARRTVMHALMCHFEVAFESVEIAHLLDFRSYFADELEELQAFADAGLVTNDEGWLCVTDQGRYVVWAICRVFDRYLRLGRRRASFEKVL